MTQGVTAQTASIGATAGAVQPGLARRFAFAGVALCIGGFWMLQHPYEGLVHDSVLYSFLALARLHPESLGHDVFLSRGSQDEYTLFSPIAAWAIQALGLDRGAAAVTVASQAMFYSCAWLLARRLMTTAVALLAVGLLVTLPSVYGALHLFSYSEPFMTPRVPAEAFVLACLAAAFSGRYRAAAVCMVAALLLHPLMAAAGLVFLLIFAGALPRPRLGLALGAGAFVLLVLVACFLPTGRVARFDPTWFDIVHAGFGYLFPSRWPLADLAHQTVPVATLLIGALTAAHASHRRICWAALATGVCGLGLAFFGFDLLRIVLVAQVQPWRWLWLTNVVAALLMPALVAGLWKQDSTARAAVMLLIAAWICIDESFVPLIALLSVAAAVAGPRVAAARSQRIILGGAAAVLALGMLVFIGTTLTVIGKLDLIKPDTTLYHSDFLLLLRRLRPWASGGVLTATLIVAAWWSALRPNARRAAIVLPALGLALCAAFAPLLCASWTQTLFPPAARTQFAPWRRQIPPQAVVLWAGKPLLLWYLLERPSYWSAAQSAGLVFSRDMAMEMTRRENILMHQQAKEDVAQDRADTCAANPGLDFIVSPVSLGPTPYDPVVINPQQPLQGRLWLYPCADRRA